jgi:hypothetical protein
MDDRVLALLISRLDRIETKVDKLMAFRSYVAGIGAACGMVGAWLHSLVKGY